MKRIISSVVLMAILWMIVTPAVGAYQDHRHYLEAQFEWYLGREGRLILDGSRSKGDIEKYYWVIRGVEYGYLVERGHTRIFQTSIYKNYYGPGRYWVTLTVTGFRGRESSITEKVIMPQKYQRRRQRRQKEIKLTIELTKEEKIVAWFIIGLAIILSRN